MKRLLFGQVALGCLAFFTFALLPLSAQYNKNWVLGPRVMLSFEQNGPIVNTIPNNIACFGEAGTTVSDSNGNLLFYVDCQNIFNNRHSAIYYHWKHQPTANAGLGSVTQGILSIPIPNTIDQYFLLTLYAEYSCDSFQNGSCLNLYKITANSSLGTGVAVSELPGFFNHRLKNYSEKMTAIKKADGKNWWVILHEVNNNCFVFYETIGNKIKLSHTQNIGSNHIFDFNRFGIAGDLISSINGSKVASAIQDNTVDLFSFDRCSGRFVDFMNIEIPNTNAGWYGISFSPNSRFLYLIESHGNKLYQYDIETLRFSLVDSINRTNLFNGHHLLGLDNKIYIATVDNDISGGIISVIHAPDSQGKASNFQENALPITQGRTSVSLPNLPNFDLGPIPLPAVAAGPDHLALPACRDTSIRLGGGAHHPDYLYDWSPAAGLDRTDSATVTLSSAALAPGETRHYVLTVLDPDKGCRNVATDTVVVSRAALPSFEQGPDISICPDSTALIGANASMPDWFYEWSPEAGLSDANVAMPLAQPSSSTRYALYAESPEGCAFYDTVQVEVLPRDHADCLADPGGNERLFIPNIFSPNNDGANDRFVIPNLPPNSHLQVFDRWGDKVLERENYRNNWPSTSLGLTPSRLPEGTYYYVLRLENGELYRGWVLLMR